MSETLINNQAVSLEGEEIESKDCKLSVLDQVDVEKGYSNGKECTVSANYCLNKFQLRRILNNNTRNKSIAILGIFPDLSDSDQAVVIFEKQAFEESNVATAIGSEDENEKIKDEIVKEKTEDGETLIKPSYFCNELQVNTEFINNIYGSYQCTPPTELNSVKATVIYPATEKHIEKYSISKKFLINETPELYEKITLPYITSSQFSLEWVYNILEHKQETDRIIFEDSDPENGFILLPDLKWDGRNIENLYVLAISHKHDIKSLRDLNSSHLYLLRNLRSQAAKAIETRYNIPPNQLRMYIHYQPSFYHLHVHINPVCNDAPGIWCEKSHMLDTVINNLELLPDYYKKATLPFVSFSGNKLLELYESEMPIKKEEPIEMESIEQIESMEQMEPIEPMTQI